MWQARPRFSPTVRDTVPPGNHCRWSGRGGDRSPAAGRLSCLLGAARPSTLPPCPFAGSSLSTKLTHIPVRTSGSSCPTHFCSWDCRAEGSYFHINQGPPWGLYEIILPPVKEETDIRLQKYQIFANTTGKKPLGCQFAFSPAAEYG